MKKSHKEIETCVFQRQWYLNMKRIKHQLNICFTKKIPSFLRENNLISIWNNGKGIPVVEHKVEKMYVPALIFGQLLTSSNYDDEEKKVTGRVLRKIKNTFVAEKIHLLKDCSLKVKNMGINLYN